MPGGYTIGVDCDVYIAGGGVEAALLFVPDSFIIYDAPPALSSDPSLLLLNETVTVSVRSSDYLITPDGRQFPLTRDTTGSAIEALLAAAVGEAAFNIWSYIGLGLPLVTDVYLVRIEQEITPAYDDYRLTFQRKPSLENGLTLDDVLLDLNGRVLTLGDR